MAGFTFLTDPIWSERLVVAITDLVNEQGS